MTRYLQHSSHWGSFTAAQVDGRLVIQPNPEDPDPSPLLGNIPASLDHPARLRRPLVRRGWLEDGPGPDSRRGHDDYVEMDWPEVIDLVAAELRRLGARPGADPACAGRHVFGGSYGWSSAGRFHHAQSQVHRFLNTVFGGYVRSVESYSTAAGTVILSYVLGDTNVLTRDHPYWEEVATQTELLLTFGGLPLRNTQVSGGGNSLHIARQGLQRAAQRGCRFVSVSPLRDDFVAGLGAEWIAPRPGTDVALMLALAWHVATSGRIDRDHLARYTSGYELFEPYLLGASDGQPKDFAWAAEITRLSVPVIAELAEAICAKKTLININYALQRQTNGEQPVWMALTLAAMLGQTGEPGAGFAYGLGSIGNNGKSALGVPLPTFPQGRNGISDFIPVSRVADLLLRPGETYTYKGQTRTYADIRLVYWAGGNPFHHHQDLRRLREAFARPDTVIVHETATTATTRHADIVLPATTTAEREDIGAGANDPFLYAMERLAASVGEARDDYDIFAEIADRLGCRDEFTEGLDARGWLARMYEPTRKALADKGRAAPDFDGFWQRRKLDLPARTTLGRIASFHADPAAAPLPTESGRIVIGSETIARHGGESFPPHPAWRGAGEWLGDARAAEFPLQLIANQPATRLHSQLDYGDYSQDSKINGHEPIRLNPADAVRRAIAEGDIVRVFNARGAVLAGARLSEDVAPGIVQLSTGAWYSPDSEGNCLHGNPNVLTPDIGASPLSQGCVGQLALVEIEPHKI